MTITAEELASGPCRIDVDGGQLYLESYGDGPAVLLVHGWSLDHRSFAPQIDALSPHYRVIVYDRRGFGSSDAPPDLGAEVADIDRLLDATGAGSAHLVGVSQGGRIALRYAAARPGRLRSLTLQGAMIDGVPASESADERIPIDEFVSLAREGRIDEIRERWLAHPMMQLSDSAGDSGELLASIVRDYEARDLVDFDPDGYRYERDTLAAIRRFDRPVLVATGAGETRARKAHARRIVESAPLAREVIFEHSSHLPNLEEAGAFNAVLLEFFDDADRRLSASEA